MSAHWSLTTLILISIMASAMPQHTYSAYYSKTEGSGDCTETCSSLRCAMEGIRRSRVEEGSIVSCFKSGIHVWQLTGTLSPTEKLISDCSEADRSGIYTMAMSGVNHKVYCLVDVDGKWTVIQRREDGNVDFYRNWANYSEGFGDVAGEHWLGNDNIHTLTAAGQTKLRIDLEDWENNRHTVYYNTFRVAGAGDKYKLTVSDFVGSAPPGDSLSYHNGGAFSTYDQDNDVQSQGKNCAKVYRGAWWYLNCHATNLNGEYNNNVYGKGVVWYHWKGHTYSLKNAMMMIRKP